MVKSNLFIVLISLILIIIAGAGGTYFTLLDQGLVDDGNEDLVVKVQNKTAEYTGSVITGFTPVLESGTLPDGYSLYTSFLGSGTDVGTYTITPEVSIYDDKDNDVTNKFVCNIKTGILTITKKQLTFVSNSFTTKYQKNMNLSKDKLVSITDADTSSFLQNCTWDVKDATSITSIGTFQNRFGIEVFKDNKDITDNLDITIVSSNSSSQWGTINVTACELIIALNTTSKENDGTPLTNINFTCNELLDDRHIVNVIYKNQTTSNYEYLISDLITSSNLKDNFTYTIVDEGGHDVSTLYDVKFKAASTTAKLSIVSKESIDIALNSLSKIYDGTGITLTSLENSTKNKATLRKGDDTSKMFSFPTTYSWTISFKPSGFDTIDVGSWNLKQLVDSNYVSIVIKDASGNDVTSKYNIKFTAANAQAKVSITPFLITIGYTGNTSPNDISFSFVGDSGNIKTIEEIFNEACKQDNAKCITKYMNFGVNFDSNGKLTYIEDNQEKTLPYSSFSSSLFNNCSPTLLGDFTYDADSCFYSFAFNGTVHEKYFNNNPDNYVISDNTQNTIKVNKAPVKLNMSSSIKVNYSSTNKPLIYSDSYTIDTGSDYVTPIGNFALYLNTNTVLSGSNIAWKSLSLSPVVINDGVDTTYMYKFTSGAAEETVTINKDKLTFIGSDLIKQFEPSNDEFVFNIWQTEINDKPLEASDYIALFNVTCNGNLPTGYTYKIINDDDYTTDYTDWLDDPEEIEFKVKIYDSLSNDVTNKFDIEYVYGNASMLHKSIQKPSGSNQNIEYDGNAHSMATMYGSNDFYKVTINSPITNVGDEQECTIELKDGSIWSDGTFDDVIYTWTIVKKNINAPIIGTLNYTIGDTVDLSTYNSYYYTVEINSDDEIEATIKNEFQGNVGFLGDNPNSVVVGKVIFNKKKVSIPSVGTLQYTFGVTLASISSVYDSFDTANYDVDCPNLTTDCGTYDIKATISDTDNYEFIGNDNDTVIVGKVIISPLNIAIPNIGTINYELGDSDDTSSYSNAYYNVSCPDFSSGVGIHAIEAKLIDSDNVHFVGSDEDTVVIGYAKINKHKVTIPSIGTLSYTYGINSSIIAVDLASLSVSNVYDITCGSLDSDCGNYPIYAQIINSDDYKFIGTNETSVLVGNISITPLTVTISYGSQIEEVPNPNTDTAKDLVDSSYVTISQKYSVVELSDVSITSTESTALGTYTVYVSYTGSDDNIIVTLVNGTITLVEESA